MAEVAAFARRAPVRVASADRRARIAALVMATSDATEPPQRSRASVAIVGIAALVAAAAVVIWRIQPAPAAYAVAWPVLPVPSPIAHATAQAVTREAPPAVAREVRVPAPVVTPAAERGPAQTGASSPAATSRVFAGSQEREGSGAIARDQVTLAPAPTAFERGWTALREQRYADAIAAFDLSTEPAVAEDAAYWAAIASARGGDRADAARRLTAFISKFSASARIADARALLARLAP